jgi:hypothetical protein
VSHSVPLPVAGLGCQWLVISSVLSALFLSSGSSTFGLRLPADAAFRNPTVGRQGPTQHSGPLNPNYSEQIRSPKGFHCRLRISCRHWSNLEVLTVSVTWTGWMKVQLFGELPGQRAFSGSEISSLLRLCSEFKLCWMARRLLCAWGPAT